MKWLIIALVALAGLITGLSVYLQPNDFLGCGERPVIGDAVCHEADAIIVVSGGDTNARTDEGIKLYKNGWADTLILSGAAQDKSGPSNAAAMRTRALAAGVPARDILVEEFSETTEQNAQNSQSIFDAEGYQEVILVTSGYHQRRASLEFDKRAGSIEIRNRPLLADRDWHFVFWWLTPRGWWLAVGETVKIIVFYVQGEPV